MKSGDAKRDSRVNMVKGDDRREMVMHQMEKGKWNGEGRVLDVVWEKCLLDNVFSIYFSYMLTIVIKIQRGKGITILSVLKIELGVGQ